MPRIAPYMGGSHDILKHPRHKSKKPRNIHNTFLLTAQTMSTPLHPLAQLPAQNRFASLPADFHIPVSARPLSQVTLVSANAEVAQLLGLDPASFTTPEFVDTFSGNLTQPWMQTVAAIYAGHQFGHFVPQLGDGRALLLGEIHNDRGEHWELQLKGAGPTPFSRGSDGRAVLRSSIREYLCSEAMYALGIPTTRALCLITSPDLVWRETPEPAAVVTRVAPSFVRFGSFELFYARGQTAQLTQLADYVITHDYPALQHQAQPYLALLQAVVTRTATLIAGWQAVGFCHGVMNTDNMSILGLTLDYGPFGFLDGFDPGHICNHSDEQGRYAYNQQAGIAYWNLRVLAAVLSPLLPEHDAVTAVLQSYIPQFESAYEARMAAKLGLVSHQENDAHLIAATLGLLASERTDYPHFWRQLGHAVGAGKPNPVRDLFIDRDAFDTWWGSYQARLALDPLSPTERQARMHAVNPVYVLRNHLAERAIRQAEDAGDFSEVQRLFTALQHPFTEQAGCDDYAALPPDWATHLSVSCSS